VKMSNLAENTNVVLKYADPEGDFITLSTDLELEYALSLSGSVIRIKLTVDNGEKQQTVTTTSSIAQDYSNWRSYKKDLKYEWKHQQHAMRAGNTGMFGPAQYHPYPIPGSHHFVQKKWKELDARFISHVTIPDDTEIPVGTTFEKTWRIRNNGINKWPEGSFLLQIDRANDMSAPELTPVTCIVPNEETNVTVKLTCPSLPGRYQTFFKLCSPNRKKFGQRMRCQILSVNRDQISQDRLDKTWEQLEAMGFVEKGQRPNHINYLICQENCDITRIVRLLTGK